jgi:protein gp37
MSKTKNEWTDATWNPVTGCTKTSPGCANCCAQTMARRLQAMGSGKYARGFAPTLHPGFLSEPLKLKKPHSIFVCSMSDLFHEAVPFSFADQVMDTVRRSRRHRYQLLTKRALRMRDYFSQNDVPENVWLGVTVEDGAAKARMDALRGLAAPVLFISCEPLIGPLGEMDLSEIDWVIAGGKAGRGQGQRGRNGPFRS